MRFEMRSISETEIGSAPAPMVTSRPSGRNPCMLSTIALVELEVLRMTSAPPAAARPLPSRTTSSAPRSRIILSLSGECETAIVTKPAAFAYFAATLPPFAAPGRGLNPGGTHAGAHLSRGDVLGHAKNLADWLVAEDSGEWSRQVSERLMYVGVADAACMHLHEHLVRSGLRLRNVFD